MLDPFKTFFAEPLPTHANPVIHPDGSVHYFVEGRHFFAGFVSHEPDGSIFIVLARPYAYAVVSGSLNQVLRRYRSSPQYNPVC